MTVICDSPGCGCNMVARGTLELGRFCGTEGRPCDSWGLSNGAAPLPGGAIRTDPVAELHIAVPADVGLELLPPPLVGEHALAIGADPDEAAERLDFRQCALELV